MKFIVLQQNILADLFKRAAMKAVVAVVQSASLKKITKTIKNPPQNRILQTSKSGVHIQALLCLHGSLTTRFSK